MARDPLHVLATLTLLALCLVCGAAAAFALLLGLQRLEAGVSAAPVLFAVGAALLLIALRTLFDETPGRSADRRLALGALALSGSAALMLVGGLGAFA